MTTVEVEELPGDLKRLAVAATEIGWQVWATHAAVDGVETIAVRLGRGEHRCYGVWTIGTTPKGKLSAKWRGGAARIGRHFPTVKAFKSYAGLA